MISSWRCKRCPLKVVIFKRTTRATFARRYLLLLFTQSCEAARRLFAYLCACRQCWCYLFALKPCEFFSRACSSALRVLLFALKPCEFRAGLRKHTSPSTFAPRSCDVAAGDAGGWPSGGKGIICHECFWSNVCGFWVAGWPPLVMASAQRWLSLLVIVCFMSTATDSGQKLNQSEVYCSVVSIMFRAHSKSGGV